MARKFTMAPAVREGFPVLLGVAGPSSSGKTLSSLYMATGIQSVVGGDLAVLDTEGGRALEYADRFKFQHVPLSAPFNALSYVEGLRFIESKGVKTAIVDSMSHEHEGAGGHLSMQEAELDRMAGPIIDGKADWAKRERMKFSAWAKPAAERRQLVLYLQQTKLNLILCFRAKEKLVLMKNSNGKMEPTSIGFQPIAGDEYAYEMKALVVLPPRSKGVPDLSAMAAKINDGMEGIFPAGGKPLDKETGVRFAKWSANGVKPGARTTAKADAPPKDDAGEDPPDFVPDGGWPKFSKTLEWADWSETFLKEATRPMAEAWSVWWSEAYNSVSDKAQNGNAGAGKVRDRLKAALAEAMKRAAK